MLSLQIFIMRTAVILLALATVCLAAAIDKSENAEAVIPVAVSYDTDGAVSDVAADTTLSRSKRAPLLLAKLKLLKLGLLGLGAVKVAKVAKIGLIGAGFAGVAGLAARGGSSGGGSYSSSTNYNSESSYNSGASYNSGPSDTTVVHETVVSEPAPYPAAVPHQSYGVPQTFTAHKDVVISYNAGG